MRIDPEKYYKKRDVVKEYDAKRFSRGGGTLVNKKELQNILALLRLPKKSKILDAGAGTGRLTRILKDKGFDVYCLDTSEEMIKKLKKIINPQKVKKGSVFKSPFKKESFNAVISLRVLHHFNLEDSKKIIKEFLRITKKRGSIIFNTFNSLSLEAVIPQKRKKLNYHLNINEFKEFLEKLEVKYSLKYDFLFPFGFYMHSPRVLLRLINKLNQSLVKGVLKRCGSVVYWKIHKK